MAKKRELTSEEEELVQGALYHSTNPAPLSASLDFEGRRFDLNVNGLRQMDVAIDPTELGVKELKLNVPGIRVRIVL